MEEESSKGARSVYGLINERAVALIKSSDAEAAPLNITVLSLEQKQTKATKVGRRA
jgi:hypothetical protein